MTAEQLYQALDRAGLTPPVHYCAAPHEWREALERIEVELEAEVNQLSNLNDDLEERLEEVGDELRNIKALMTKPKKARAQ